MSKAIYGKVKDASEWFDAMLQALFMNPFNAIPVIDDLANTAYRLMSGKRVWKVFSTPLFDDLADSTKVFSKKDISMFDVLESIAGYAEPITGAPIRTYLRMYKKATGRDKGGRKKKRRLGGKARAKSSRSRLGGGRKRKVKKRRLLK